MAARHHLVAVVVAAAAAAAVGDRLATAHDASPSDHAAPASQAQRGPVPSMSWSVSPARGRRAGSATARRGGGTPARPGVSLLQKRTRLVLPPKAERVLRRNARHRALAAAAAPGFVTVTDVSETVSMEVPAEWRDVATDTWAYATDRSGVYVAAAPDLGRFYKGGPGAFLGVSRGLLGSFNVSSLLTRERQGRFKDCTPSGTNGFVDPFYAGTYEIFVTCRGGSPAAMVLAAVPIQRDYLVLLWINMRTPADRDAANHILATFQATSSEPGQDGHH